MLGGDKKKIITITFNYYIIVNKFYLYNYSDKITHMIMGQKIKIKISKQYSYMIKINKKIYKKKMIKWKIDRKIKSHKEKT